MVQTEKTKKKKIKTEEELNTGIRKQRGKDSRNSTQRKKKKIEENVDDERGTGQTK